MVFLRGTGHEQIFACSFKSVRGGQEFEWVDPFSLNHLFERKTLKIQWFRSSTF